MKKYIIGIPITIAVVLLVSFLSNISYSNYKNEINVNISDTTGKLICDASLDNPGTYVSDDGWAYFIVTVKNYNTSNVISDVPVEYNLKIKNASGYNAYYRVSTGSDIGSFNSNITTSNYKFTTGSKQTRDFIVEVKTNNQDAEDVKFNIDLNCYQSTK